MQDHLTKINRLRSLLQQPLPGRAAQERMTGRVRPMPDAIPDNARPSGVLALLFPKEEVLHLLLIRRTEDGRAHSGQLSFPGGRQEPFDADLKATALREAWEEAGVSSEAVDILGALTPLYIPVSNFMVYPFVGYSAAPPQYRLSELEVAEVLELPVDYLFDAAQKINTTVRPASLNGLSLQVPAYRMPDETVLWGATAMILSELEAVWEQSRI